jgi:hypothetical protein
LKHVSGDPLPRRKRLKRGTKEVTGMITKKDKDTIIRCAKRYNVESVILFGSSTRDDVGMKGIDPRLFFAFIGAIGMRYSFTMAELSSFHA